MLPLTCSLDHLGPVRPPLRAAMLCATVLTCAATSGQAASLDVNFGETLEIFSDTVIDEESVVDGTVFIEAFFAEVTALKDVTVGFVGEITGDGTFTSSAAVTNFGDISVDTFQSSRNVENRGDFTGSGTRSALVVQSGGTFDNQSIIRDYETITVDSTGLLDNQGLIDDFETIEVRSGGLYTGTGKLNSSIASGGARFRVNSGGAVLFQSGAGALVPE